MEIKVKYVNLAKREVNIKTNEALGLRMLNDDFDTDWKRGDEPHGTMIFTDVILITSPETIRDLAKEIDDLKAQVKDHEARLAKNV